MLDYKKVVYIDGEYVEVSKSLAIQVIADEVADWVTVAEDTEIGLEFFGEGDSYFFYNGELYTENDDAETLLELAGYKVEYRDDLNDYDTSDIGYYDIANMQWMI